MNPGKPDAFPGEEAHTDITHAVGLSFKAGFDRRDGGFIPFLIRGRFVKAGSEQRRSVSVDGTPCISEPQVIKTGATPHARKMPLIKGIGIRGYSFRTE